MKQKAVITAKFTIGQLIEHRLFGYRGVIFEVDPYFMLTDEWYEQVAKLRPPRNEPWYQVMPDKMRNTTYVAQQNLRLDRSRRPITHPDIGQVFVEFRNGVYLLDQRDIQ